MTPDYADPLVTLYLGDCLEVMAELPADSVDAVVTDPPYGLEFMGKDWDSPRLWSNSVNGQQGRIDGKGGMDTFGKRPVYKAGSPFQDWCQQWATEALRVTKPGGYLLAFGGTRTHHRLVCGLEDAGWIIRDELDWIYACLSDDTELLTREHGWVRYNRANEGDHAAAFDPGTGVLRWERIEAVHQYDHSRFRGYLVEVGPSLVTQNHRVILDAETGRVPRLPRLWDELPSTVGMGEAGKESVVLEEVQRQAEAGGPAIQDRHTGRLDRDVVGVLSPEDDGLRESGLEGRRYRVQEARQLYGSAIRAIALMGRADGPQGRVRHGASATDGRAHGLPVDANGMRESREPRSNRQPSREPNAVARQSDAQAVRVREGDRGDGLPTGDTPSLVRYAGVVWCITVPSGAFVARRNGIAFVTGNSGFPKGKANLKPAHEPIVLARKPGPLRPLGIDDCRIGAGGHVQGGGTFGGVFGNGKPANHDGHDLGRWPSNVLLSSPALFDEPNPWVVGSGVTSVSGGGVKQIGQEDFYSGPIGPNPNDYQPDSGGYSRFFLIPKADRQERERGLSNRGNGGIRQGTTEADAVRPLRPDDAGRNVRVAPTNAPGDVAGLSQGVAAGDRHSRLNSHPTVKPIDLMRHLVRLVTPPGGVILDPFLGSGTTCLAASEEGFKSIGIEREAEYLEIAKGRLMATPMGLGLDTPIIGRKPPRPRAPGTDVGSVSFWGNGKGEEPAA